MAEPSKPDDIEELMRMLGVDPAKSPAPETTDLPLGLTPPPVVIPVSPTEESAAGAPAASPPTASGLPTEALPALEPPSPPEAPEKKADEAKLDLLSDVNVKVRVELGRSRLSVQDVLRLGPGAVVPLESLTSEPLNIYVNDRLIARGEVLVVDDNFAIRVTDLISPE